MTDDNAAVVVRSLEAFDHDLDGWLATLDPAITWYPIEEAHIPSHGVEGAMGIRERWLAAWEGHSIVLDDLRQGGGDVVVSVRITGRGRGSGVDVDLTLHSHLRVRGGRIFYVYEYAERAEALAAAGLEE